jgi:threonine dehydratase
MRPGTGVSGVAAGPTFEEILAARERIRGAVHETPLERSAWLSEAAGCDVYLKLECWQRTRSFKLRGALNAVAALDGESRRRGLVTASAGNHGQALALAARRLGAAATIFVPRDAPAVKKARIAAHGASLDDGSGTYDDAEVAAEEFARRTGATFVHAFSDAAVVAGQGTIALEIAEALPDVRTIVVPVGGGGLIAGIGIAARAVLPGARLIGVQSTETHAVHSAFAAGRVVPVPVPPTLADGLAGCTDAASFERVRTVIDGVRLVEECAIRSAIRELFRHDGVVAEGGGAVGAAAIAAGAVEVDGPLVVVISGGNIDAARLAAILSGE